MPSILDCMSEKQTPLWPKHSPASLPTIFADLSLTIDAKEENAYGRMDDAGRSSLLHLGLAVRPKAEPGNAAHPWRVSLGDIGATGVVTLLLDFDEELQVYVVPQELGVKDLAWVHCYNMDAWEAIHMEAKSPASQMLTQGKVLASRIGVVPASEPASFDEGCEERFLAPAGRFPREAREVHGAAVAQRTLSHSPRRVDRRCA